MAGPTKRWEEEESDSSSSGSGSDSPAPTSAPVTTRRKFDDEEAEDSDVLDSWDAAEDSEVEREKAKKAAEVKAKAEAEAAANKKSKAQRIAERQAERARQLAEEDESSDEETEAQKRERLRATEKESDLRHAEDLFSGIGISSRKATSAANAVLLDPNDPNSAIDLAALPVFNPSTKTQFELLRNTLVPILSSHSKKAHYSLFLQEFCKQLAKDLPSDQIKKVASTLTTLSNEKMKEEKAAEKGGKKSKAAKTKTTLAGVGRPTAAADVATYDDAFGDDDFM